METVPAFDSSRYHSIPEPNSSARTLENQKYLISAPLGYQDASLETPTEWQHLPGQNLKGGMIPRINPMPEYQNKMKISWMLRQFQIWVEKKGHHTTLRKTQNWRFYVEQKTIWCEGQRTLLSELSFVVRGDRPENDKTTVEYAPGAASGDEELGTTWNDGFRILLALTGK